MTPWVSQVRPWKDSLSQGWASTPDKADLPCLLSATEAAHVPENDEEDLDKIMKFISF